jgi:hypothetical protein
VKSEVRTWWVVGEQTAANSPALAGLTRIGQYQPDRSRREWLIFEVPPSPD